MTVEKSIDGKKKKKARLSRDQKRINHISSEQKRRLLMRESYDKLVKLIPDLDETENRSEWQIYEKTKHYLNWLYGKNLQLREQLTGTIDIPPNLVWKKNE